MPFDPDQPRDEQGRWTDQGSVGTFKDAGQAIHAAASDRKMLSNGKRSNLDDYEYDFVKTNEFKNWFGDSKAVDENGEPMVFYHGTKEVFTEFSKEKIGLNFEQHSFGFHFSSDPYNPKMVYAGDTGSLKKVFLKIENPLVVNAPDGYSAETFLDENRYEYIHKIAESRKTKNPFDGVIVNGLHNQKSVVVFEPSQIKIMRQ